MCRLPTRLGQLCSKWVRQRCADRPAESPFKFALGCSLRSALACAAAFSFRTSPPVGRSCCVGPSLRLEGALGRLSRPGWATTPASSMPVVCCILCVLFSRASGIPRAIRVTRVGAWEQAYMRFGRKHLDLAEFEPDLALSLAAFAQKGSNSSRNRPNLLKVGRALARAGQFCSQIGRRRARLGHARSKSAETAPEVGESLSMLQRRILSSVVQKDPQLNPQARRHTPADLKTSPSFVRLCRPAWFLLAGFEALRPGARIQAVGMPSRPCRRPLGPHLTSRWRRADGAPFRTHLLHQPQVCASSAELGEISANIDLDLAGPTADLGRQSTSNSVRCQPR